jgi:hypothetical protein
MPTCLPSQEEEIVSDPLVQSQNGNRRENANKMISVRMILHVAGHQDINGEAENQSPQRGKIALSLAPKKMKRN